MERSDFRHLAYSCDHYEERVEACPCCTGEGIQLREQAVEVLVEDYRAFLATLPGARPFEDRLRMTVRDFLVPLIRGARKATEDGGLRE